MTKETTPFIVDDMVDKNYKNSIYDTSFEMFQETFTDMVSFFRKYPDYFLDYIRVETTMYQLTPFQRVMLRSFFRFKKVGIVGSRGISKTWSNLLGKYLRCVLYPNSHEAVALPTKEQSAKVAKEKIEEYWRDYPLLQNEVSQARFQRDYIQIKFKNGSTLDTLTMGESSRGLRANGISIEEITDDRVDKTTINEIILPIADRNRYIPKWGIDVDNEYQKTQTWVTTASHKQSYAYEKFRGLYDEMQSGKPTIVLITDYRMGVYFGTMDMEVVEEKKNDPSYSPLSFDREYMSIFTGSSEQSLVTSDDINKCRVLKSPMHRATKADKENPNIMFVLAYDVARSEGSSNAQSALVVIRCENRGDGTFTKQVVNIYNHEGTHFTKQAQFLKEKVNDFGANILIVDHNGLGKGLTDELVKEIDSNPPYAVVNDDRYIEYKKSNSIPILFLFNSASKELKNSNVVNHFMTTVASHDIQMLVSETTMRSSLPIDKSNDMRLLMPHIQTDIMIEEIMNLEYVQTGNTTTAKQISKSIQKDRYSALSYGLYWIYLEEQKNIKRKSVNKNSNFKSMTHIRKPTYKIF